jgi:hypothetical protein
MGTATLAILTPVILRRTASTFPVGTGLGADNVSPRSIARLSDELLMALAIVLMKAELLGA